jgi:hypothetical protein
MITSPTATFSAAAAQALNQALRAENMDGGAAPLVQNLEANPVPEPTTLIVWGLGALSFAPRWRHKARPSGR